MQLRALFLLLAVPSSFGAVADDSDAVILAAMRLSDAPNYRWNTTVVDDARTYQIRGQTAKEGFTRVKMPIVNAVRRRLGRSVTDVEIEAIFKGNVRCVFETEEGWKTIDELPPPLEPPPEPTPSGLGILGGIPPPRPKLKNEIGYSNLQLGISHPHEELGVIVTSHTELQFNDGIATGALNNLGAQLLLVRDGQEDISPIEATGTFKLWIRDGIVTRYQLELDGVLLVASESGRRQVRVRQTSDTLVDGIGTTAFDVPYEVRQKLGS